MAFELLTTTIFVSFSCSNPSAPALISSSECSRWAHSLRPCQQDYEAGTSQPPKEI